MGNAFRTGSRQAWFATHAISPCVLTYEALTRKQADGVNADWAELLRSALGRDDVG